MTAKPWGYCSTRDLKRVLGCSKRNQKIPSPTFCCCTVLRGHWTPFPPLPKGDLPVPFPAVMFARTEQARGGESVQWWQEAMSAKPHSQGCFMSGQNSGENAIIPPHPSGQDWSHVRGLPPGGTSPGTQECFWAEMGKGIRLQAISG